jgi:hypothetical protein
VAVRDQRYGEEKMRYYKDRMPSKVSKHLMPHEVAILAVKRHPVTLIRYAIELFGASILAIVLSSTIAMHSGYGLLFVWLLWLFFACRFLFTLWNWTSNYFVVTSQRMILVTGFIELNVAMLPLVKVADMRMTQSIGGRIFGYGEFWFSSVADDDTFKRITYVPDPNMLYLELTGLIFPPDSE